MHKCLECDAIATWMRCTQFSGDHPYCTQHAEAQSDWDQSGSYGFWYAIQTPDEIGTLEGQQEFDFKRNYHYSNTNNPVDFPQDPKPEIGEAAIVANIAYYLAVVEKHDKLSAIALAHAKMWQQKLQEFIK